MKTIYNETQYAEKILVKKEIDGKNGKTLAILCKYYYFEKNKTPQQIIRLLSKFLDETDGFYDKDLLPELVEKYTSDKMKPINVGHINITLAEVEKILSRPSDKEQKLMYSMLVAYKFKNERCKISEEFKAFVDNRKITTLLSDCFRDVKIHATKQNKINIMGNLVDDGVVLLDMDKVKTFELTYVDESSPVAFQVKHENDIWVDLEIYKNKKSYRRCECCGSAIKLTRKRHNDVTKYCSDKCKKYEKNKKNKEYYRKNKELGK